MSSKPKQNLLVLLSVPLMEVTYVALIVKGRRECVCNNERRLVYYEISACNNFEVSVKASLVVMDKQERGVTY